MPGTCSAMVAEWAASRSGPPTAPALHHGRTGLRWHEERCHCLPTSPLLGPTRRVHGVPRPCAEIDAPVCWRQSGGSAHGPSRKLQLDHNGAGLYRNYLTRL